MKGDEKNRSSIGGRQVALILSILLLIGLPSSVLRWKPKMDQISGEVGVPTQVLACVIFYESGGNPNAVSRFGAVGLMQVVPMRGRPSRKALFDPLTNLRTGAQYLDWLIERSKGDLYQALLDYNGGPYRRYTRPATVRFARTVYECAGSLGGA
jgi:soluble lytic murein transglycosylase-like protein